MTSHVLLLVQDPNRTCWFFWQCRGSEMTAALAAAGLSSDFKFSSCSHEPQPTSAKSATSGGLSNTGETCDDPMDLTDSQSHSRTNGLVQAARGYAPLAELLSLGALCKGEPTLERQPTLESPPMRSRKRPAFLRPVSGSPQHPLLAEAVPSGSLGSTMPPAAAVPHVAQTYLQLSAEQQQQAGGKRHHMQFPKDASLAPMQWQQQESGGQQRQRHHIPEDVDLGPTLGGDHGNQQLPHHQNQQVPRDCNPNPNPNQWQQQRGGGQQHRQQPLHKSADTDPLQMQQQAQHLEARGQQQAAAAQARQQHASFMPVRFHRQPVQQQQQQQQQPENNAFPAPSARNGRNGHEAALMRVGSQTGNAAGELKQTIASSNSC